MANEGLTYPRCRLRRQKIWLRGRSGRAIFSACVAGRAERGALALKFRVAAPVARPARPVASVPEPPAGTPRPLAPAEPRRYRSVRSMKKAAAPRPPGPSRRALVCGALVLGLAACAEDQLPPQTALEYAENAKRDYDAAVHA